MKQEIFRGFGPSDVGVGRWRMPVNQAPDIVALCADEAHAVRLSLDYAMRRFGQAQKDVAEQMGVARSRLSEWRKPERTMPEKHREAFVRATGCNLLAQHIEDVDARKRASGQMTQNERDRAIVALMTGRAA